jgi:hypothetical protein
MFRIIQASFSDHSREWPFERKLDFRDPWLAIARVSKSTSLGNALWLLCRIRTLSLHSPGLCKRKQRLGLQHADEAATT